MGDRKSKEKKAKAGVGGELLRDAREVAAVEAHWHEVGHETDHAKKNGDKPPKKYKYIDELARLQFELIKLQEWVKAEGLKVCIIFEGRDAAGKGGVIKRIAESLNPRVCRIVALGTPTEKERGQWYFQRYVAELPAKGEIVLFDRSWYNRAGVEKVMGFCNDEEYKEFLRSCPLFEEMLVRSGIHLIKYWFSVSDEEQERRFIERSNNPIKRWKLSPMDLESRKHWVEYSQAKDLMLKHTDLKLTPWHIVDADNKKRARLNCMAHLLHQIPYQDLLPAPLELPARQPDTGYKRPAKSDQRWVPKLY
ncbi:polyphosphate kinase [Skermanella stibiiresistens SB22]|uniref:ADP/GDP-polyphosphate phosphotransferase n=1 Tax=Skermanella stibiiresistens SB22 TaxID=1385369 RepID=W9GUX6_9PROT|nr:polyphosphate kinase 2 [Skermanella stibiiresistens]EWY37685.1 polyphosphate kinase [Skermanella stibiiresistens SB22]